VGAVRGTGAVFPHPTMRSRSAGPPARRKSGLLYSVHGSRSPPPVTLHDDLLARLSGLLRQSRRVEADLVAHIGEVDARRLYAREATPSMFVYCTLC
jgi:hypothetical protein